MNGSGSRAAAAAVVHRATLLWGALLGTLVLYLVLALAIGTVAPLWPKVGGTGAVVMLYGAAATFFAAGFVLRRALLRRVSAPGATDLPALQSRYLGAVMASNAVVESVALLALVGHLVGLDAGTMFTLVFASAICMLALRPRLEELEDMLPRGPGAAS